MAESVKHIVRFWRGERAKYNLLKNANAIDAWTRYSVSDADGTWTEYFGENVISIPTGQLLPVIDIVSSLPATLNPGDRYLVGSDADNNNSAHYYIVSIGAQQEGGSWITSTAIDPFDEKYGVRVKSRGLKNYVLVDGILKTYDDVDCGDF